MSMNLTKRDIRQNAYRERSRSARGIARLLMPFAFVVLGTAIWQDPDLGPKLAEGLEVIRPTAASYLVDTPLEDILGPVPEDDLVQDEDALDQIVVANGLPESTVPVNRN